LYSNRINCVHSYTIHITAVELSCTTFRCIAKPALWLIFTNPYSAARCTPGSHCKSNNECLTCLAVAAWRAPGLLDEGKTATLIKFAQKICVQVN